MRVRPPWWCFLCSSICFIKQERIINNINMPMTRAMRSPRPSLVALESKSKSCESDCLCSGKPSGEGTDEEVPSHTLECQQKEVIQKANTRNSNARKIVFVDTVDGLSKITDDDVQLAVWRQSSAPKFSQQLSNPSIMAEDLPSFEGMVRPKMHMISQTFSNTFIEI